MNTFTKSSASALLTVLVAGAVAAPARSAEVFDSLPSVSQLVTQVGEQVAADVASYFRNAVAAPKAYPKRRSPSVVITEIETMVVAASRLPAMETVVVAATRLPSEVVVVEATRLPPMETVVVEATRLPNTDENATVVVASASPVRL